MERPEPSPEIVTGFMTKALRQAEKSAKNDEVPVGAVVVIDGRVVGRGSNWRESKFDPCGHAEIAALRSAARQQRSWRLTDAIVYVTLEPCPMCLAACQQARVGRVVYGAKDPKGGALSLGYKLHLDTRLNHRFEVVFSPFEPAGEILRDFFRKMRRARTRLPL